MLQNAKKQLCLIISAFLLFSSLTAAEPIYVGVEGRGIFSELTGIGCSDGYYVTNISGTQAIVCTRATRVTGESDLSGNWTWDTNTVHIDSTANRIGIGTTSPSTILHVSGSGSSPIMVLDYGSNTNTVNASIVLRTASSSNYAGIELGRDVSPLSHIAFLTRNSASSYAERIRIDAEGYLGVGTNAPGGVVDVYNSATSDTSPILFRTLYYDTDAARTTGDFYIKNKEIQYISNITGTETQFYMVDADNTASRLTFDFRGNAGSTNIIAGTSTGNIGIGTTSPLEKLHVVGAIYVNLTGTTDAGLSIARAPSGRAQIILGNESLDDATQSDNGEVWRFGMTGAGTNDFGFFNKLAGSNAIYIESDNNNVGIGSSAPENVLHLSKSSGATGADNGPILIIEDSYTGAGTASAGIILERGNAASADFSLTNNQGKFEIKGGVDLTNITGGTLGLAQLYTGEVGIGTNSPSQKLDVRGDMTINDTSPVLMLDGASGNVRDLRYLSNGGLRWILRTDGTAEGASNAGSNFVIDARNDTTDLGVALFIYRSSGNTGIGTSSPVNKLDVEGAVAIGSTYSGTSSSPTNGLIVEGNVGIGTTSPAQKLTVVGTANITGTITASAGAIDVSYVQDFGECPAGTHMTGWNSTVKFCD